MKFVIALLVTLAVAAPAFGVTLDRCKLGKKMLILGVPKPEVAIWTCIAEHESSFRTEIIGTTNGTTNYGIFQINDKYWCQPADGSHSDNGCNLSCNNLLTNSVKNSVACARLVQKQQGWEAWSTWRLCSGRLPSIGTCFEDKNRF